MKEAGKRDMDKKRDNNFDAMRTFAMIMVVVYLILCLCPSILFQRPGVVRQNPRALINTGFLDISNE